MYQSLSRKWIEVNYLSSDLLNIRFKILILRLDLCEYSDVFIVVKRRITVEEDNDNKTRNNKLIFKNNATFRSCISKIRNTFIDNAEDLDIIMPMYKLLQYSENYSTSLWNYYRDEVNDDTNENDDANTR